MGGSLAMVPGEIPGRPRASGALKQPMTRPSLLAAREQREMEAAARQYLEAAIRERDAAAIRYWRAALADIRSQGPGAE